MIPERILLRGYQMGVFPMANRDGEIFWFSPDPRGILPLDAFRVPHGLRRRLEKSPFEIRINSAFPTVMRECAAREETWINEEIIASYTRLHAAGMAHSVECWSGRVLVGGLYGVAIGGAFFGESMFHHCTDASKVALQALVERLVQRNYQLLDIQWVTPHLVQFGAVEIPRLDYLERLSRALDRRCNFL